MISDGIVHPTKKICKTAIFLEPLECYYWFHIIIIIIINITIIIITDTKKLNNNKQRKYLGGYNINTQIVDVLSTSNYEIAHKYNGGRRWRIWLRHCVTSRKVADSILEKIIAIFYIYHPCGRSMALGLIHPPTEMSTRNFSYGVKAVGAYGWQPYRLYVPIVLKSGSLDLLEHSERVQDCNWIALLLPFTIYLHTNTPQDGHDSRKHLAPLKRLDQCDKLKFQS